MAMSLDFHPIESPCLILNSVKNLFKQLCQPRTLLRAWNAVKEKGSTGGVDGMTIQNFEQNLERNLAALRKELADGSWIPEPYLKITIPKNESERRTLGLLSVRDKIVQQTIKHLIEPRFEKEFVSNSYGYRPKKGHCKAVRFALSCCRNKNFTYLLRLDIDNYFDTINHEILFRRIAHLVSDEEVERLIQLCVKMGMVSHKMKWKEVTTGVPQGAVLSPLLANYYLQPFDQFVLTKTKMYVRYADDFIIGCSTKEEAEQLLIDASAFLESRLKLTLNPPIISEIKDGVEFLGLTLNNKSLSLSNEKKADLENRIRQLEWNEDDFCEKGLKSLAGIKNYYAKLLPQDYLALLDETLFAHLETVVKEAAKVTNKSKFQEALKGITFFSEDFLLRKHTLLNQLVDLFLQNRPQNEMSETKNRKLILKKKNEYRKKENETSELVVGTFGANIGVSNQNISVKVRGKKQKVTSITNLQHITILSEGVSISSNALAFCMKHKIGIDVFERNGKHVGSFLSMTAMHTSLWSQQQGMSKQEKSLLATNIITGKIKNQLNLVKYYHKYHKDTSVKLQQKYREIVPKIKQVLVDISELAGTENYQTSLVAFEAKAAELYWEYVEELISDDDKGFTHRERHGATDLVNCMLNYGYAILYARILRMVLKQKLNPTESVIHVAQAGKPTFVYDIIEIFRAQAVDRVVISLVQKREPLNVCKGLLDDETKKLLVKNLSERLNRYEKYQGVETRLVDIIANQIKQIAGFVNKREKFKPYVAKW